MKLNYQILRALQPLRALRAEKTAAVCMLTLLVMTAQADVPTLPLLRDVGIDQKLNQTVPQDLPLLDETNSRATPQSLENGKPIILVLIQFNCPSLCTTILNDSLSTLKVIPQNLGTDYDVWTVSIDPTETPTLAAQKKQGYVKTYLRTRPAAQDASAGWHFLTGSAESIKALTHAVGYRYRFDEATNQFVHPAALIILTPEGKISRYFFGVDYNPTDLRLSLVEASHGKIGSLTDKVLLFCYHYDPATGKYGLAVANLLRAGAALTVLALIFGIGWLWRADRRRTRQLMPQVPEGGSP